MACGTVTAEVQYLKRLPLYTREKPFQLFVPVDKDAVDTRSTNLEFESREQTFEDIRGREQLFSLDEHGFEIGVHPTELGPTLFGDREIVESKYFEEVKEILRGVEGGYDEVFFFDWRLRNSATPKEEVMFDMNDLTTWLRPSPNVHVDQSPRAVLHRVLLHLPDKAAFLLQGRVRVINVWRPINNTVEDYPLAFCDPSSVPTQDHVECDHVRRKFKGANMYFHFGEKQKWYYLGQQQPEEVLLMKMFDSDPSVKAKSCPHASFHHPLSTANSTPRKSIEVRALVFNYP
ncbi:methyltransferase CmcJ [Lasiosphaeria hispida]|uniref:Methyltransferase CmcJ n=1 Tax=Lasiosphaeria hispida TaxID=260671 RepID=A0AAJ0MGM9_9PEZI|nr:methyltransferase CmcJ [Lasiosphaeria hispida]